jgi:hypothetical protein
MNKRDELLRLKNGKMLTESQMGNLLGSVPEQSEVRFNVPLSHNRQRSINFRRWTAEGRTVWEVTE